MQSSSSNYSNAELILSIELNYHIVEKFHGFHKSEQDCKELVGMIRGEVYQGDISL